MVCEFGGACCRNVSSNYDSTRKMRATPILLILVIATAISCGPRVQFRSLTGLHEPWNADDGFVVFPIWDSVDTKEFKRITNLRVQPQGLEYKCDYWTVVNLIMEQALLAGGNGMKIVRHQNPDEVTSCHRIEVEVYRIAELWKHEKIIRWTEGRQLGPKNFKADTTNRPNRAKSTTTISYSFKRAELVPEWYVEFHTNFHTYFSYFKGGVSDKEQVEHEQNHFNITEIEARRLTKRLKERGITTSEDLDRVLDQEIQTTLNRLDRIHDKYDSEVLKDSSRENSWNKYIIDELDRLTEYKKKRIKFEYR